jgi:hypothetical protein
MLSVGPSPNLGGTGLSINPVATFQAMSRLARSGLWITGGSLAVIAANVGGICGPSTHTGEILFEGATYTTIPGQADAVRDSHRIAPRLSDFLGEPFARIEADRAIDGSLRRQTAHA